LKSKVKFVTFPFFVMVELQNFLNAPRIFDSMFDAIMSWADCIFARIIPSTSLEYIDLAFDH